MSQVRNYRDADEKKEVYRTFRDHLSELMGDINPNTGNTFLEDLDVAIVLKALSGNVKAQEYIRDTLGQKPSEKIDISSNDIKINILNEDD